MEEWFTKSLQLFICIIFCIGCAAHFIVGESTQFLCACEILSMLTALAWLWELKWLLCFLYSSMIRYFREWRCNYQRHITYVNSVLPQQTGTEWMILIYSKLLHKCQWWTIQNLLIINKVTHHHPWIQAQEIIQD